MTCTSSTCCSCLSRQCSHAVFVGSLFLCVSYLSYITFWSSLAKIRFRKQSNQKHFQKWSLFLNEYLLKLIKNLGKPEQRRLQVWHRFEYLMLLKANFGDFFPCFLFICMNCFFFLFDILPFFCWFITLCICQQIKENNLKSLFTRLIIFY